MTTTGSTDPAWDDLHPETRRLLSRRGFVLGAAGGAGAITFLGMTVMGCSSTTTSSATTAAGGGSTTTKAPATSAPSGTAPGGGKTLYDRLGGAAAVTAVVGGFLETVAADNRINKFFAKTNIAALQTSVIDLIGEATGGPQKYKGATMKAAHAGMGITVADFNAFVEDLVATLDGAKVPATEKTELLNLLAPMQPDIVTA